MYKSMTQTKPTTSKDLVPDEHALAFCFKVLSGAGSMGFATLANLLRPWGWTRTTLLDRFNELQQSDLVLVEYPDTSSRDPGIRVSITSEGRSLSGGTSLPFRRATPGISVGQVSDRVGKEASERFIHLGRQS